MQPSSFYLSLPSTSFTISLLKFWAVARAYPAATPAPLPEAFSLLFFNSFLFSLLVVCPFGAREPRTRNWGCWRKETGVSASGDAHPPALLPLHP